MSDKNKKGDKKSAEEQKPPSVSEEDKLNNMLERFDTKIVEYHTHVLSECSRIRKELINFEGDKKKVDFSFFSFSHSNGASSDKQNIKHVELQSIVRSRTKK